VAHPISFVPTTTHTCHKTDSITGEKGITVNANVNCTAFRYRNSLTAVYFATALKGITLKTCSE
jgi:hypothetical protein